MNRIDEKLFEYAEEPLRESLDHFMKSNDLMCFEEGIHHINYYDAGESDTLIMMIPSISGNAIAYFNYIQTLSKNSRVIAPSYDAGRTLLEQCEGFIALAKSMPHKKMILFGYSFGGVIAQLMTIIDPDFVHDLILFDTETKTKHIHPELVKKFVKSYRRLNRSLYYLPEKWMYRSLSKKIAFDVKIGLEEDKHFWEAFYTQILLETSKEQVRLLNSNVREFWKNYELTLEEFDKFKGRVIILNVTGASNRVEVQELAHMYKNAEIKVYDNSFRMSLVTCYKNVISDITNLVDQNKVNDNYEKEI